VNGILEECRARGSVPLNAPDYTVAIVGAGFCGTVLARELLRRAHEVQDLTLCIAGSKPAHLLRGLRLDPADATCELLLESVTFDTW